MNSRQKLRIALVGLGTWAKTGHLPLYVSPRFDRLVDVVALCGRSIDKTESWAEEFAVPYAYDDYEELLRRDDLDAIVVCTPDHAHYNFVMGALEAGLHVLVEKPLAMKLDECRAILQKADEKQKNVITLYHKRADSLWAEAARRVGRQEFGDLRMGSASIQNPITVPNDGYFMSDLAAHSNPNWFLGTHFYDLLRFITHLNPREVMAYRYHDEDETITNRDSVKVDCLMDNGGAISVFLSWNLSKHYPSLTRQEMRLHFDKGELDLDGTRRGFSLDHSGGYNYVNPYFMRETSYGSVGYCADFLEAAILYLLNPNQPLAVKLPSHEDSWWASAMAAAVEESIQTGKRALVQRYE